MAEEETTGRRGEDPSLTASQGQGQNQVAGLQAHQTGLCRPQRKHKSKIIAKTATPLPFCQKKGEGDETLSISSNTKTLLKRCSEGKEGPLPRGLLAAGLEGAILVSS